MSKKTLNAIKTLQEAFEKNKELTIPQMMTLLNCNRISVNNYIHRLEDTGIEFQKRCENRLTYYSVRHSSEESSYEPLTLDILRKYQIVRELQAKPVPRNPLPENLRLFPAPAMKILTEHRLMSVRPNFMN